MYPLYFKLNRIISIIQSMFLENIVLFLICFTEIVNYQTNFLSHLFLQITIGGRKYILASLQLSSLMYYLLVQTLML